MLKQFIPFGTMLLVLLYITTCTFQKGIAAFYGYPEEVISSDITSMLNTGFSIFTIAIIIISLLPKKNLMKSYLLKFGLPYMFYFLLCWVYISSSLLI